MGAKYYTHIWEKFFPSILQALSMALESGQIVKGQMPKADFEAAGNRQRYSFTITYTDGNAPVKDGSAVCRDLQEVLGAHPLFVEFAKDKIIAIRLNNEFILFCSCKIA
jgi:hypothetical protein